MIKIDAADAESRLIRNYLIDLILDVVPSFVFKYNQEALDYPHDTNFNFKISCLQQDCLNPIKEGRVLPANIFLGMLKTTRAKEALSRATIDDGVYLDDGEIYQEELDYKRDGYINEIEKLVSLHDSIAHHYINIFMSDLISAIGNKNTLFKPQMAITEEDFIKEVELILPRKLQPTPEPSVT